jgi:hypothetical protein
MITFVTVQHISAERLALYAEHERLCLLNDRVSNEKRQEIWKKLVSLPTKVDSRSEFDEETNTKTIHLTWRE